MIHYKDLKFQECHNYKETGNSIATIAVNEYQLDIIKKPSTKTYKVKPFEITLSTGVDNIGYKTKHYKKDEFPEYGEFPEFKGRELLLVFLNEIDKQNLSGVSTDLDESPEDLEL